MQPSGARAASCVSGWIDVWIYELDQITIMKITMNVETDVCTKATKYS